MALKVAGTRLIAQNFQEYMRQMGQINKAHKAAFGQTENIRKQNSAMAASQKQVGGLASVMESLNLKTIGVAGAVALATKKLVEFGNQSAMIAARNETLGIVLKTVGSNAGYTQQQIAFAEETVKKMGITTQASRQALIQMAQAEIEWAQASQLARIAQDAAVIANTNSSESFQNMIYAIQSGNVRILRTLGINVSFQRSYDKMAKTLGTTSEALTEQQKAQARVNAVIEAGEKISGTYEAAMGTVGKKMTSVARAQEEAQAKFGEFFKVFLQLRVEAQTNFWNAMNDVGNSFRGLAEIVAMAREGLSSISAMFDKVTRSIFKIREGQSIWYALGKSIHDIAALAVIATSRMAAFSVSVVQGIELIVAKIQGKAKDITFGDILAANIEAVNQTLLEKFPILMTSYEEIGVVAKSSLDRGTEATQRQITALKQQQAQLEASLAAFKKIEDIQLRFQRAVADENRRYAKAQEDFARETAKKREDLQRKLSKDLQNLERDATKKQAEIIADANRKRVEDEKKRNFELEQERRRFELAQMQSMRRFQLDERRLAAEGDILGLIRLREDFALRQQEEREGRDLDLREQAEQERQRQQQEQQDIQRRLEDLRREVEERRQEIFSQHAEELAEFQRSNEEKRAEMQRSHQERLEDARRARNESLQDLGRALQEEQKLTQEGMQAVAAEIAKVFGDQGAADTLIQGWSDRSQSVMAQTLTNYQERLLELARAIEALESGETIPSPTAGAIPSRRPRRPDRVFRMQHGGSGVVTGPATFEVEPGITEAFSFRPVRARSTLDVNFNTLNVAGLEGASPGVVDAAVEKMWQTMQEAVDRLSLRKGRG